MKNIFKLSALAVLAVGLLASCEEKEIAAPEVSPAGSRTFTLSFAQPDTKVAVTDAGKTTWEVGDQILIHGEGSENKAIVTLTAENIKDNGKKAIITVEGVEPYDRFSDRGYTSTFYAQYPAQFAEEGTNYYYYSRFSKTNGLLMAGYNEGDNFVFYNLCGVISFTTSVDFDSYVFEGNNGETVGYTLFVSRLAGKGEGNEPVLEWKYSHTTGALTVIEGTGAAGQVNYIGLPLGTDFTAGFKLALKKGENVVATLATEKPVNVARGKLLPLGDITSKLESTGVVDVDTWDYTPSAEYVAATNNLWKPIFDGNFDYVFGQVTGNQVEEITESKTVAKKESTYKFTFKDATEGEWGCCNFLAPLADHPVALKAGTKYNLSVTLGATAAISKCIFSLHTFKADADNREGDWLTDLWGEIPANTPTTFTDEFTPSADIENIAWTIIPQFGTPAGMKFYIKDIIIEEVVVPAKFEWRVEADTLVNVPYNEAGAAHWYVEKDADVEYVFKVYTDDGNVYTENGPGITIEPAANHVAINYAVNENIIPRKWMITATTTATNVEKQTLTAMLIQGAYEYTDLKELNKAIIASGNTEVTRIINITKPIELTKVEGSNVFAQGKGENFTGGILLYGTGLEKDTSHGIGWSVTGRVVAVTKAFNGVPEVTKIVSGAETLTWTKTEGYPCQTKTIAELKADYDKFVNVKCNVVCRVIDAFSSSDRNGKVADTSGDIAVYVQLREGIVGQVEGANLSQFIVWPSYYRETQQLGVWADKGTTVASIETSIKMPETLSLAVHATSDLKATTNSTATITYSSSDTNVATVSAEGIVTANAVGTATITASVEKSGLYKLATATCVVTVTEGGAGGDESDVFFELYTGEITEGCYIIYYGGKAMNTTTTSNRLQYLEVTPEEDKFKNPDNEIQWFIEKSGDNWTLRNPVANDYAVSTGTKNQATTASEPGEKGLWTITETEAGSKVYEIVNVYNQGKGVNANLRNNTTYGFATYATSTGGPLTLYKKK